jgi:hypothetical protein
MATVYAWFSAETALTTGSSNYRKLDGSTVNVTRTSGQFEDGGRHRQDEKYVGMVMSPEDGGCVRGISRVAGISQ